MTAPRVFTRLNHLLIALLSVTTLAGVVALSPDEQLPIHWDITGQPDHFVGRDDALIIMPVLALSLLLLFWAIGRFAAPGRVDGARHVIQSILPVMLAMFLAFQVVLVWRFDFAMVRVVTLGVATLLIVLGNVLPKSQPNRYGGIRIPSTLADPANWAATHRLTGLLMMAAGGLLVVLAVFSGEASILLPAVLLAVLVPILAGTVYSLVRARR